MATTTKQHLPLLSITGLSITRNGTMILDDLHWRVNPGEHWVILGSNGSGKTSLLNALTGYLMPSAGGIELMGEQYGRSDWRELRKKIGMVSSGLRQMMGDTEPALETVVSGKYAIIDYWGRPKRADVAEARVILGEIGCAALEDRPWAVLSQGERQRILIGRALMAKPSLLILDEPCAGLDPVARDHFLHWLSRYARGLGRPALVLVTHHVEEIMPVFTHALLLKNGKTITQGSIRSALNSKNLSATFGASVQLAKKQKRFQLAVRPEKDRMM